MRSFIYLIFLLFSFHSIASELRALVRIEKTPSGTQVYRLEKGDHIPSITATPEVKKKWDELTDGTEALVEGHITYEMISIEDPRQLRPYFVIEKIFPVSLSALGTDATKVEALSFAPKESQTLLYAKPTFPVTTEVASAIAMTTGLLLLEELTAGTQDPDGQRDLKKTLLFSAGSMATLLFVYEQLSGKTKP